MPIFQESPSQLKSQVYVYDTDTEDIVALTVDSTGSISVTGEVGLASGTEVALAAGSEVALAAGTDIDTVSTVTTLGTVTNDVKVVNGTTGLTVGLASGSEVALASGTEVGLASGAQVALAAGSEVALAASSNIIGKVENELVFTNVDSFGGATPLTSKTVATLATVESDAQDISQESSYNWFIQNEGTLVTQTITLIVEISPDGTNWISDTGTIISLANGVGKMITVTNFLKYARFVITGGAADTSVISCFQAQH
ncbi:MAG: DUF6385 domain-containing protein [Eubacteriales bacterium]